MARARCALHRAGPFPRAMDATIVGVEDSGVWVPKKSSVMAFAASIAPLIVCAFQRGPGGSTAVRGSNPLPGSHRGVLSLA